MPILKGDDLLGVIVIHPQDGVRPFTDKQIVLVETFADQAAIAIENVRLLDELRERTRELGRSVEELRALGEVSQAINSTLELETVLSTIVANAVQLSGTDAGAIYVFDDPQREFRLRATYGMDQELIEALTQRHIGLDEPNITPPFLAGEPIQVPDLREAISSAANDIVLRAGFRALLIAPLLRGEAIVGMLVVRRRTPGTFPRNTLDLIKTFAAQSAVAIENARLFQDVETSLEDLRTAQDRLVQTQKLASLGQLTAGIAHEIKNPLNFVNNFSAVSVELIDELRDALGGEHLSGKLREEISEITDTLQSNLDKIVQHGKRADALSRTCCCIRVRALESIDRSISTPWSRRASILPITARGRRSRASILNWRSPLTRRGRGRSFPARDYQGAAQPDLQWLLRGYEAQSGSEWRQL